MPEPVCDLSAYADGVQDPADLPLLTEAVEAASVGALRLAYIGVWCTCAESLKRRFRSLAPLDDAAAKVHGKVQKLEADGKSVDSVVLAEAHNYGLLTETEYQKLLHVYQQRCIYGHPYEEAPTVEDLVSAAARASAIVLGRPLKLREGYLARQLALMVEERTLLDEVPAPVDAYARSVFHKADERLHVWFIYKVWQEAEEAADDPSLRWRFWRLVRFSQAFILEDPAATLRGLEDGDRLLQAPRAMSEALAEPGLFRLLGEHVTDIVVSNLLAQARTAPERIRPALRLSELGLLTGRQEERLPEALSAYFPEDLLAAGLPLRLWYPTIVRELRVRNWYRQNPALQALRAAGPDAVATLTIDAQAELGRNVLQAADGTASNAVFLLEEIAHLSIRWPSAFIEGVVVECFANETGQVRFKHRAAAQALRTLMSLATATARRIVRTAARALRTGTPKDSSALVWGHAALLDAVNQVSADSPEAMDLLAPLREALTRVGPRDAN